MIDRKDDNGKALNAIRAVRASALNAINDIDKGDGRIERRFIPAGFDADGYFGPSEETYRDPDADEMVTLLEDFVAATEKFAARTGRRR